MKLDPFQEVVLESSSVDELREKVNSFYTSKLIHVFPCAA